jgi:hypothetical protein
MRRDPRLAPGLCRWLMLPVLASFAACGGALPMSPEAQVQKAAQERYAKAKALFEERCKTAGVVIKRTVKDVEGIELTKIRQPIPWAGKEYFDPMYPEAAMAGENRGADGYIKQFLMTEFRYKLLPERRGDLGPGFQARDARDLPPLRGYHFVEYLDGSGTRFRCVPTWKEGEIGWTTGQHRCDPVQKSDTRYSLDYENLVNSDDRALWIAGTKLKAIDKHTGEVVAQLTRYVWDQGLGGSSTGRWPWQSASTTAASVCPSDASQPTQSDSRYFIDAIFIPKQGV